jgi:methylmalonyl-CoA/ethylmalonyl-CoA epimerase
MNPSRVDHVGIAVASLEEALAAWRLLGLSETHREEVPSQKVRVAFLSVGESAIELLEPTSPDSPIAKFLAKRGPGLHHVCFRVVDIEASIAELEASGCRLLNRVPAPGAAGKRVAFLHPDSGKGVLIELAEKGGAP